MARQVGPRELYDPAAWRWVHLPVFYPAQERLPAVRHDRDEIRPSLRLIVSAQPERSAVVDPRIEIRHAITIRSTQGRVCLTAWNLSGEPERIATMRGRIVSR